MHEASETSHSEASAMILRWEMERGGGFHEAQILTFNGGNGRQVHPAELGLTIILILTTSESRDRELGPLLDD